MSLAHNFSYRHNVDGSAARPLPHQDTQGRPARKPEARRSYRARILAGAVIWIAVMGLVLLLVHRNTQALAEASALTQLKDQLAALEASNQELEAQLVRANSAGEIETWAIAHGMQRPARVTTVPGNPDAVAVRPQAAPVPAVQAAVAEDSLWGTVKAYLARFSRAVNLAGGTK